MVAMTPEREENMENTTNPPPEDESSNHETQPMEAAPPPAEPGLEPETPDSAETQWVQAFPVENPAEPASENAPAGIETVPNEIPFDELAPPPIKPKKKRSLWRWAPVLGVLVLLLIAAGSAYAGYQSGIQLRTEAETGQVAQRLQEQYQLGIQDIADGQYYRARQRFEYIIRIDPAYPGVTDQLAAVLLELNTTATPTLVPTPTLTPTPDTRGVDDLYNQAQSNLLNSDWSNAIDAALRLRKMDPDYKALELDGLLFLALRNRGIDKIKRADLEGGIYDLSLAERFGPLDNEAQGYQTWTRLYITGASFWEINWEQAVYYFEQVAPQLPALTDGSGMTARERYQQALVGYGNQLLGSDGCLAAEQFQKAFEVLPNPEIEQALADALKACNGSNDEKGEGGGGGKSDATPTPKNPKYRP